MTLLPAGKRKGGSLDTRTETGAGTPRHVGAYQVLRSLGHGGMGEVLLAWDPRLERQVAIKAILSDLASDNTARARFVREAKAASKVVHPYVATVLDVVTVEDQLYVVMEYIEGKTLDSLFTDAGKKTEQAILIATQIAEALAAIHKQGFVHRDLKPGNVMVSSSGHIKVLDFGIARKVRALEPNETTDADTHAMPLTRPGAVLGTPAYSSPEQLRGAEVDTRSDIFSLGVLLFELFTGTHPFKKDSMAETISAILSEAPCGASPTLPTLTGSIGLRDLLYKAMAKDPAERYGSAAEIAEELQRVREGRLVLATRKRRRFQWGLGSAAMIVVAVLMAWGAQILASPPQWDAPRYSVAVVPPVDRTGLKDGALRSAMIADLIVADLESSRLVRVVGPEQLAPALSGLGPEARSESILQRIKEHLSVDYVVVGSLYFEDGRYLATFDPLPTGKTPELPRIRAEGGQAAEVAERFATTLRRALPGVPILTAWRDDRTRVEQMTSSSPEARLLYERGLLALRDGKLGEAISRFEAAIAADPEFALAWGALAEALTDAGYGKRAQTAAGRSMELAPTADSAAAARQRLKLEVIHSRVFGVSSKQIEVTGLLAQLYPDEPWALQQYAWALSGAGQAKQASDHIDAAIRMEKANPSLYLAKARILLRGRQYEDALDALEHAERLFRLIESEEGGAEVLLVRGQVRQRQQHNGEAQKLYQTAIAALEQSGQKVLAANAELNSAQIDIQAGRPLAAKQRLARVRKLAHQVGHGSLEQKALATEAALLFASGELPKAETTFLRAVKLGRYLQNDALVLGPLFNLASLTSYTGRLEQARIYASDALELARTLAREDREISIQLLISDIEYQRGELEEAIGSYQSVLAMSPEEQPGINSAWAHLGLAEIYERRGRLAAALEQATHGEEIFSKLSMPVYQAYGLVRRSQLHSALGRNHSSFELLDRAQEIADSTPGQADLQARCSVGRAVALGQAERWKESRGQAAGAVTLPGAAVPAVGVPAHVALCQAELKLGSPARAVKTCQWAVDIDRAPLAERIIAQALLAEALAADGQNERAQAQARQALDEAERMGLLSAAARAAAVLLSLGPDQPAGQEMIRRTGQAAVNEYLAAAPSADRSAMRKGADLSHWSGVFQDSVEGRSR